MKIRCRCQKLVLPCILIMRSDMKKPQQMSFSHNKINTKVTENINANDDLSVFPFRYLHNCKKKLQLHRECMNNLFVKSQ